MKFLKRIMILAIAVAMAFSFAACGGEEKSENSAPVKENSPAESTEPAEKTAAQKYVDEHGEELEAAVKEDDSTIDCEVAAEGNNVVITMKASQLDGLTEEEKTQLQQIYDMMKDSLKEQLAVYFEEMDGIDSMILQYCDSKGSKVVELNFELE